VGSLVGQARSRGPEGHAPYPVAVAAGTARGRDAGRAGGIGACARVLETRPQGVTVPFPRPTSWLLLLAPFAAARAEGEGDTPDLLVRASVTVQDGVVWFRPGELLVGDPALPGRPAVRLLGTPEAATLPLERGDFEDLGAACRDAVRGALPPGAASALLALGDLSGDGQVERITVRREAPAAAPEIRVVRGDRLLARALLPVPAEPCVGLVAEVQVEGPPDLVVVWASRGADHTTLGATVLALP